MPSHSRHGRQPLADFIKQQGYGGYARLARQLSLNYRQLYRVALGYVTPSPYLRDQLPLATGRPLSSLFTEEALAATCDRRAAASGYAAWSKTKAHAP
jgi:hypothetical protein